MQRINVAFCVAAVVALAAPAAYGQAAESMNKCQKMVAKEGGKYLRAVADTIGKCLYKASSAVIVDGVPAGSAADDCIKPLLKLTNSADPTKTLAAKFNAKVGKACDPAINPDVEHVAADTYTIGPTKLSAANLNGYCQSFGGGGMITSFNDWRDCLRTAADCQANQAIATQWPRVLEYTDALLATPAIMGNADALAALTAIDAAIDGLPYDGVPSLACGPAAASSGAGLGKTGQTTAFGPGSDGDVQAGVARSFTSDPALGTITDNVTDLTWEMKDDSGGMHDRHNSYRWSISGTPMDGAIASDFLDKMNNRCDGNETTGCTMNSQCTGIGNGLCGHAGHRDWRVANLVELASIWNMGGSPAVFPAFNSTCVASCTFATCSCPTASSWSSTTQQADASRAWLVDYSSGFVTPIMKNIETGARAVRGGL